MNYIFIGSTNFSLNVLKEIINSKYKPKAIISEFKKSKLNSDYNNLSSQRKLIDHYLLTKNINNKTSIKFIKNLKPSFLIVVGFNTIISKEILDIGKDLLINPKEITVSPSSSTSQNIESLFVKFDNKNKLNNLISLIGLEKIRSAVVFCNKKKDIEKVNLSLKKNNYQTVCLHGDMDQNSRINSLDQFKKGSAQILIASDVAARGIDVDNISHVFNYDVPNNPEDYVHRIGRTGRAGKKGKAFTIYEEYDEKNILMIEKVISQKVKTIDFKKISLNSSLKNKKNDGQNNTEIHNSTKKAKPKFLPIENFLNFKDSGKIPNFLVSKN